MNKLHKMVLGACGLAVWSIPGLACAQSFTGVQPTQALVRGSAWTTTVDGYEPIVSRTSNTGSGRFNSGVIFIADQLDRNAETDMRSRPTVITSFANLNDLNESSPLGRLVGEHLMHELQVRAWNVADIRLTKDLIINNAGEFSLSRDIAQLRQSFPVSNVVTGTYSVTRDGVLLNVRIIDSARGRVISTAQTRFLRDGFITSLVDKPEPAQTIKLKAY
jgi:TolB-like protein